MTARQMMNPQLNKLNLILEKHASRFIHDSQCTVSSVCMVKLYAIQLLYMLREIYSNRIQLKPGYSTFFT